MATEQNMWRSVTYGNGLFVAVAQDGVNRVMTSPDGITWTARMATEQNDWYSITYGNGLFVAIAGNGTNRVMTSPDGINWTPRVAAEQNMWYSVIYGNGRFVAVALNGTNRVMTAKLHFGVHGISYDNSNKTLLVNNKPHHHDVSEIDGVVTQSSGTWTPNIIVSVSGGGEVISATGGMWTRVGDLVNISLFINLDLRNYTQELGMIYVTNLPFVPRVSFLAPTICAMLMNISSAPFRYEYFVFGECQLNQNNSLMEISRGLPSAILKDMNGCIVRIPVNVTYTTI
jgi:hypothetical protein